MSLCRCAGSRQLRLLLPLPPLRPRCPGPQGAAAFHLSAPGRGNSLKQLQRMLAKHRKKHWYQLHFKPVAQDSWLGGPQKQARSGDSQRSRTLNSLLMSYIVDLMSTSEVAPEVCHLPMEIVKVKISPDCSACCVYWRGLGSKEQDQGTAQTLQRCTKRLRYLLISYRLIGNVPPIVFVRDKQYAAVAEVEHLLSRIQVDGFGEELEGPADPATSGVPSAPGPVGDVEGWGPPLPADVFGVDRDAMLQQIAAHKKSERERPSALLEPTGDEWLRLQRQQRRRLKQEKKAQRRGEEDITPAEYLAQRLEHDEMRRRQQAEWHSHELDDDGNGNGVKDW